MTMNPQLLRRIALVCAAVLLIGLLGWALKNWASGASHQPRQQVARIALLTDTPPPPPPPPPKEPPPAPKSEPKPQQVPDNTPKPPAPADNIPKVDGPAGNGPSALVAGNPTRDISAAPGGPGGGASAPSVADRAAERLYASGLRQALREELERQLPAELGELNAQFALWLTPEGRLQRWELEPGAPAAPAERTELNAALTRSAQKFHQVPPPGLTQPLRFRLTVRAGG